MADPAHPLATSKRIFAPALLFALASAPAARAEEAARAPQVMDSAATLSEKEGPWAHGHLDLRYQLRSTGEADAGDRDEDQDLRQEGVFEGGYGEHLRAEVSGRLHEDIDGQGQSRFRDLYDSYGDPVVGFLHTAYAEGLDLGPLARVRAGRQFYGECVDVRFDGGLVETAPLANAVKLSLYGGSPVNLYESTRRGDWLVGGAAEVTALPRTTIRLDYAHLTEDDDLARRTRDRYGFPADVTHDDDLWALEVAYRVARELRVSGRAQTFEGRSSRLEALAQWQPGEGELSARLKYACQLGAYRSLAIAFAPYDDVMGPLAPYHEVLLDAEEVIDPTISIAGGAQARILQYSSDEGPLNHGFGRLFARVDLSDLPWRGLRVSPLAEGYTSWESADRTVQGSLDVTQDVGPVRVGAGTSYALYRFDAFFLEEREDVRTVYGSVEWRPVDALRLRVEYDFEVDDDDSYHVVRCDARFSF